MPVIDFRFRPNTKATLDGIANSAMFKGLCNAIDFNKMKPQTVPEVVEELNRQNVVKVVCTGRDSETTYGSKSNNGSVIEFVKQFPDKFIGFVGIDPHKGMEAIYYLRDVVANHGIRGAAIDPYLAQIYVNDAKYYPVYAKCCELNIPLVITTGPASLVPNAVIDHVAPRYIDFVARDFPDLKIVVSHGGYPWVNEMIIVAQRNPNVYLELSEYEFFPLSEAYIQAMNTIISDKVMFASAHPFVDFRDALANYEKLPLTPEVREKVMYGNAAKLLGLTACSQQPATAACAATTNTGSVEQAILKTIMDELNRQGITVSNR